MSNEWEFVFRERRYQNPTAILTEQDGLFFDAISNREVDPFEWLSTHEKTHIVAGAIAYEFAWWLDDVHARKPSSDVPVVWIGAFDSEPTDVPSESGNETLVRRGIPTRAGYESDVRSCVDAIYAGELFEVNLTGRFNYDYHGTIENLYRTLAPNSGPFSGYIAGSLNRKKFGAVSISPECFVRIEDGSIVAEPIKGTRPRSADLDDDRTAANELLNSEKDRAENVMIVDLMRNDLTRVCEAGSVRVNRLCELESFVGVHHLVSEIEGTLDSEVSPIAAMLRCFPAGSITGAPKLRAIELASELEQTPREFYTGSFFVSRPDGSLQSSVAIRTATMSEEKPGIWSVRYGSGGAIVSDSDPSAEYDEILLKASYVEAIVD